MKQTDQRTNKQMQKEKRGLMIRDLAYWCNNSNSNSNDDDDDNKKIRFLWVVATAKQLPKIYKKEE